MRFATIISSSIIPILVTSLTVVVNPFPAPRNITWGSSGPIIVLDLSLQLNGDSDEITRAFERCWKTINHLKWYPAAIEKPIPTYTTSPYKKREFKTISKVSISVDDLDATLQLGVNETYTLTVEEGSNSILIDAATTWGALHALTTLQQIIIYQDNGFIIEQPVSIWDSPLLKHRGIMIDTGRNFITTTKIREQIDAMSLCKMNSLHWHLVDAQSWPVEIKKYDMTKDAYSARETYSQEDIKSIVSYGKDRGVRIIPEIDMPGHARSGWQQVDPNIVACLEVYWNDAAVEPCPGQLEILDNNTYPIIKDVYNEVSPLFIDDVFHVGGDELQQKCYSYSEKVVKWYAQDSLRTIHDLFQVFFDKTQPIFRNTPTRKLTMWEDVIETTYANKVPKDIILQSWNGQENIGDLTKKGYDVIVSSAMWFYLDCGHGGFLTNDPSYIEAPQNHGVNYQTGSSWCNPYKTWQRIYDYDFLHGLNQDQKSHVIGAEVCLWAEQSDSSDITQKIWPRAAALAESTWSGNKDSNGHYRTNLATQRILNFREYLVALEIPATPLVPKYCIQNPHACDFSQNQTIMDSYA